MLSRHHMRSALPRASALAARSDLGRVAARLFSAVVDSAWVRGGGDGAKKLVLLDCEQEAAYRRAHAPGALPFVVAASGLKVRDCPARRVCCAFCGECIDGCCFWTEPPAQHDERDHQGAVRERGGRSRARR